MSFSLNLSGLCFVLEGNMPLPQRIRFKVLERDNFTCQYCGRKAPDAVLHVDHKIPRRCGGKDEMENLITSCAQCNLGKGGMIEEGLSEDEDTRTEEQQIEDAISWAFQIIVPGGVRPYFESSRPIIREMFGWCMDIDTFVICAHLTAAKYHVAWPYQVSGIALVDFLNRLFMAMLDKDGNPGEEWEQNENGGISLALV
jgi:hypothetical protein